MQGEQQQAPNTLNYQPEVYTSAQQLKAAINLAETMPPSKIRKNLTGLISLAPQTEDILLQKINLPLQIEVTDPDHVFLKTEFNRDGDSYRSPHTNTYVPASEGGYVPSGELRKIEQLGNILFGEYVKLYYGNSGVGSFYVTEGANANQFSCGFFAKKSLQEGDGFVGSWDSFNIIDVDIQGEEANFNLSTTILIQMNIQSEKQGAVDLTGFLQKKKTEKRKLGKDKYDECLVVIGEMIEDLQTVMRQYLQAVYISKTKEIIFSTRLQYTIHYENQRKTLAEGLKQIHLSG